MFLRFPVAMPTPGRRGIRYAATSRLTNYVFELLWHAHKIVQHAEKKRPVARAGCRTKRARCRHAVTLVIRGGHFAWLRLFLWRRLSLPVSRHVHSRCAARPEVLRRQNEGPEKNDVIHGPRVAAAIALALLTFASSCRSSAPQGSRNESCASSVGFSGMALGGASTFLAVHDAKGGDPAPRLSRVDVGAGGEIRCTPIEVSSWRDADGPASDLEAICDLRGRAGEFLVAESGTWEGRFGRLFHVRVAGTTAEVLGVYRLPSFAGARGGMDGDDYEGIASVPLFGGRFLILLGERGGSAAYPRGLLRWGEFDPSAQKLTWRDDGRATIEITAPGSWPAATSHRDIADLHVAGDGTLWVAATAEGGKDGPFRSVVFRAGRVTGDAGRPLETSSPVAVWVIDGFKVEALASPADAIPGSVLSIGTEDENYGGVWRPLFSEVLSPESRSPES